MIAGYIYEMEKILFSMSLCHLQSPSNTIHEIASGCSICNLFSASSKYHTQPKRVNHNLQLDEFHTYPSLY